jgi:hypothetical protein
MIPDFKQLNWFPSFLNKTQFVFLIWLLSNLRFQYYLMIPRKYKFASIVM